MRVIANVERKIKCIEPDYNLSKAPTVKRVILDSIHMDRTNGEDAIRATKLGLYIFDQKPDLKLEDADFSYIREKVSKNPAGYPNFAIGDVLILMDE